MDYPVIPVWKKAPLLRILPCFIAGLIVQKNVLFELHSLLTILLLTISFFIALTFTPIQFQFYSAKLKSSLVFLCSMLSGMILLYAANPTHKNNFFTNHLKSNDALIFTIINEPKIGEYNVQLQAKITHVGKPHHWKNASGKLLVKLKKSATKNLPNIGDVFLINQHPTVIKGNKNPGSFQADRYYETKGIFHQVNIKSDEWIFLKKNNPWLKNIAIDWRNFVLNQLKKNLPNNKKILGIAEALLIGYQEDLDPEIMQTYSTTGVVHIIAISGLHIGILYAVLWWLMAQIKWINHKKILKGCLVVCCLWIFTMMCGASPSVLRSTVMFTCILIGNMQDRKMHVMASLSASAILLLVIDPYLLWNLGFQLSYLAVLGIICFQKPIYSWIKTKYKPINYLSEMIAVTLAAQLATLPITLLYFHQFPTYFLIANLIAVPLSTAILFTEIGIVLFGFFNPMASLFGTLTHWGISFMNGMAETIEQWPNSSIKYIPAGVESTLFFYGIIVFLFTWIINKTKRQFFGLMLMICSFSVVHALETFATWNQKKFIVFHQYKQTAMVWISGRKSLWLISPELMQDKRWINQVETGVYNQFRIKKQNSTWEYITANRDKYVEVNNKKYLILAGGKTSSIPLKSIDCLIMTNHVKQNLTTLAQQTKIEQVVIAPTNSKWKIERWKKEAEALPLRCFSITDQGAYVE